MRARLCVGCCVLVNPEGVSHPVTTASAASAAAGAAAGAAAVAGCKNVKFIDRPSCVHGYLASFFLLWGGEKRCPMSHVPLSFILRQNWHRPAAQQPAAQ